MLLKEGSCSNGCSGSVFFATYVITPPAVAIHCFDRMQEHNMATMATEALITNNANVLERPQEI